MFQAINARGGRYLEAQVQGSKTQAEEGTLVILAAGDRSLFDDCQSCFKAMGKNSFYLGMTVIIFLQHLQPSLRVSSCSIAYLCLL